MRNREGRIVLLVAGLAVLPAPGAAQIRASERGSVSQTVDGTVITVDYGRPQVRGRAALWGGIVPWGKVWTPGANWATTLEASRDLVIDGHPLPAGRYSVWLQVKQDAWTAVFEPDSRRYHIQPPALDGAGQLRFDVRPAPVPFHEILTWSFPEVRATGATLRMAWGDTAVAFDIGVQPSRPVTVAADIAERYVGRYRLTQQAPLQAGEVAFDITYEDGKLVGRWENAPNPLLATVWMVHLGEGMFFPAETDEGRLVDVQTEIVFEFSPLDGRAEGFELRLFGDVLVGRGVRAVGG